MTDTAKSLADGQVASSKATIYTVPAATSTFISGFSFSNTNAATQTLIVYRKRSGSTSREWFRVSLLINESSHAKEGDRCTLATGDLIEATTTTATAVDYVITGIERT